MLLRGDEKNIAVLSGQKTVGKGEVAADHIQAGPVAAVTVTKADGRVVTFVVLSPEQGKALWRMPFAGRDRVILSTATVLADGNRLACKPMTRPRFRWPCTRRFPP